jgi:hypothetical protein
LITYAKSISSGLPASATGPYLLLARVSQKAGAPPDV